MSALSIPEYGYEIDATISDLYVTAPPRNHKQTSRTVMGIKIDPWTRLPIEIDFHIALAVPDAALEDRSRENGKT